MRLGWVFSPMNNRIAFLPLPLGLLVFIACISYNNSLSHAYTLEEKCEFVPRLIRYSLNGMSSKYLSFTLRKADRSFYILMLSNEKPKFEENEKGHYSPWRLLKREQLSDPSTYCLIAAGDRIEFLSSAHQMIAEKPYGMPGSGHPRCTVYNANVLDRVGVRIWANRELGKSFVYYLHSEIGGRDFTLLSSHDQHWIIIEDAKSGKGETCYFDRGDNIITHNFIQKNND